MRASLKRCLPYEKNSLTLYPYLEESPQSQKAFSTPTDEQRQLKVFHIYLLLPIFLLVECFCFCFLPWSKTFVLFTIVANAY